MKIVKCSYEKIHCHQCNKSIYRNMFYFYHYYSYVTKVFCLECGIGRLERYIKRGRDKINGAKRWIKYNQKISVIEGITSG